MLMGDVLALGVQRFDKMLSESVFVLFYLFIIWQFFFLVSFFCITHLYVWIQVCLFLYFTSEIIIIY